MTSFATAYDRLGEIEQAGLLNDALALRPSEMVSVPAILLHDMIAVYRQLATKQIAEVSGTVALKREDGGQALIAEIGGDEDEEFFVRLQSWSDDRKHPVLEPLAGKTVRVVVFEE